MCLHSSQSHMFFGGIFYQQNCAGPKSTNIEMFSEIFYEYAFLIQNESTLHLSFVIVTVGAKSMLLGC